MPFKIWMIIGVVSRWSSTDRRPSNAGAGGEGEIEKGEGRSIVELYLNGE